MSMMTFDLPDVMKRWVEDEAAAGGHGDLGEVVRDLIRREQKRRAKIAGMQRLVDEGRASGISPRSIEDIWQNALQRASAADKAA